jgi:uncharacterized protein (TIGR02453 family)
MPAARHFTPALFSFLRGLKANNDRDWFEANRDRYENDLREPALAFIREFDPLLHEISPHFLADDRRSGGSLFRIYRDVRFSKDKSPYKTHAGIHFRHAQAKDVHAPGYYLHLEPRQVFMGLGIWHPDTATANRIRSAIAEDPDSWNDAVYDTPFAGRFELSGDSLKRPPRGFDPEHPLVEDLKRKDFIGITQLTQGDVTRGGFIDRFADLCMDGEALMSFLCRALDVPY